MPSRKLRADVEGAAKDILRYFLRNPRGADSLEGIARWRLLDEAVHRTVEETDRALKWLVYAGLILQVSRVGSDRIFCLNQDRRADAEQLVQQIQQKTSAVRMETKKRE